MEMNGKKGESMAVGGMALLLDYILRSKGINTKTLPKVICGSTMVFLCEWNVCANKTPTCSIFIRTEWLSIL